MLDCIGRQRKQIHQRQVGKRGVGTVSILDELPRSWYEVNKIEERIFKDRA